MKLDVANIICKDLLCDRANEVDKNGILYTEAALKKLDGIENIPVLWGFNSTRIVGKAKVNYVEGKGLLCTIEGVDKALFNGKKIAPMYKIEDCKGGDNMTMVEDCEIILLGLCENHSLENIPSIVL